MNKLPSSLSYSRMAERLRHDHDDVWGVHYDAVARQANGEDVILMSVGDPDFATPKDISAQLLASIEAGRTHYSPPAGELNLRTAIAELECEATGRNFTPEQFVIMPGATGALFAVLATICDPGDEIIVPEPMYIGYRGIITALGLSVKSVTLNIDQQCALDVEEVLAQVTPRTRACLVNTPGNPFGNVVPKDVLHGLAEGLRQRGVWLISDEVYSLLTFEAPHDSLLKCTDDLSNIIVIDGLSKSHAMTGWRVGWIVSNLEMSDALSRYSGAALFGCSQFIQDAAAYALRTNGPYVDQMCERYRERRDYVVRRVGDIPRLDCVVPQAGMFVMLDFRQVSNDVPGLVQRLLDEQGVSLVPGIGFGASAQHFARGSLTHELDVLAEVFDRLEAFLGTTGQH